MTKQRPVINGVPRPLSLDDPLEWWTEEATRLGLSVEELRAQVRLSDEILSELVEEEQKEAVLVRAYLSASETQQTLGRRIEEHFLPLVRAALARDDFAEAQRLVHRCPDDVVKCFALDSIRQPHVDR
jgi:hypothetical protein